MRAIKLVQNIGALNRSEPYDVCIVGSGPSGTVLGATLAARGVRVIILESGNRLSHWLFNPQMKQLAEYESTGDTDYPVKRTTGRLVGGNSNFWTGRSERFHPSDFKLNPYTPTENSWPIDYDTLEPYYRRAEHTLRVRGGRQSQYMPPRVNPLPLDASSNNRHLKLLVARAGITLDDSPTATPRKAIRFFRVNREILPDFLSSGYGVLVSGMTVTQLISDKRGRILAAEAKSLDGTTGLARAHFYIVSCGGIQSPRLLLLSKSERYPDGIGNRSDRVGRYFGEHPSLNFYGQIRHDRSTIYPKHSLGRTHQFYETFRAEGLGALHAVCIQSYIFPNHLLRYRPSDIPKEFIKTIARIVRPTLYISPTIEMRPDRNNRVILSETKRDPLGNPVPHLIFNFGDEDRELLKKARNLVLRRFSKLGAGNIEEIQQTWSRHHIGTCRMGDNPATSVVDRNLRVHDCKNLYICGSEVFVTGAAIQPVLTITALAHRLSDHIVSIFEKYGVQTDDHQAERAL